MTYELFIETPVQDYMSNFEHTREGLMKAFDRIEIFQLKGNFVRAKIISQRDGLIFETPKKFK